MLKLKNKTVVFLTAAMTLAIVAAAASISLVYSKNTKKSGPIKTETTEQTPDPLPSTSSSPETNTDLKQNDTKPAQSGFHLASAKVLSGQERKLLVLTGNGFGSGYKRVIFENDPNKYAGYGLYNWFDNKIELYLDESMPENQTFSVTVERVDGKKSNSLKFSTGSSNTSNATVDCKTPTNFSGSGLSASEVQLNWDTDPNVKEFRVLQGYYNNGTWDWLYPRSVTSYEGLPNGSLKISVLQSNSTYYFSLTVWCKNGYSSKPTNNLAVTTLS